MDNTLLCSFYLKTGIIKAIAACCQLQFSQILGVMHCHGCLHQVLYLHLSALFPLLALAACYCGSLATFFASCRLWIDLAVLATFTGTVNACLLCLAAVTFSQVKTACHAMRRKKSCEAVTVFCLGLREWSCV